MGIGDGPAVVTKSVDETKQSSGSSSEPDKKDELSNDVSFLQAIEDDTRQSSDERYLRRLVMDFGAQSGVDTASISLDELRYCSSRLARFVDDKSEAVFVAKLLLVW